MSADVRTLTEGDAPTVWPECETCGSAFAFRRAFTMSGTTWLWSKDCKHKGSAKPVLMTADGPYEPSFLPDEGGTE